MNKFKLLKQFINETLWHVSPPKSLKDVLKPIDVEANTKLDAARQASDSWFQNDGVRNVDPFSVDIEKVEDNKFQDFYDRFLKLHNYFLKHPHEIDTKALTEYCDLVDDVYKHIANADRRAGSAAIEALTEPFYRYIYAIACRFDIDDEYDDIIYSIHQAVIQASVSTSSRITVDDNNIDELESAFHDIKDALGIYNETK